MSLKNIKLIPHGDDGRSTLVNFDNFARASYSPTTRSVWLHFTDGLPALSTSLTMREVSKLINDLKEGETQ
jgi:NADH:ubiquinone oxidoreductase subunit